MKRYHSILISVFALQVVLSCEQKTTDPTETKTEELTGELETQKRTSPLEIKEGQLSGKAAKIQYGSPAVKGRIIWGDLVPYNVVWRTGANEATFIEIAEDVQVEGELLKAGKYSIFTIPKEKGKWTLIFNSDWDLEHGHFQYDEKNDVLRVEVEPVWESTVQENLSIDFESPGLVITWEKLRLAININ